MGWFTYYLHLPAQIFYYNWATIVLLGFEIFYITLQAARGQLSHFNRSTPLYAALYSAMAFAATTVTLYTAYISILFFSGNFPDLPGYYLWSIRLGIIIFVVFALEGAVMGGRMSHTIGGPDGEEGLPVVNWSTKFGDPRIAHFVGLHGLQVLPVVSFFILKDVAATILMAAIYGLLAVLLLRQALKGKPFLRSGTGHQHQANVIS